MSGNRTPPAQREASEELKLETREPRVHPDKARVDARELVDPEGFEPSSLVCKTRVFPLDDGAIFRRRDGGIRTLNLRLITVTVFDRPARADEKMKTGFSMLYR